MAIDIWEGPREQLLLRPYTPMAKIIQGNSMLALTMEGTNTNTERKGEEGSAEREEQGEETMQKITVHHPNLSKLLERRQAMRGTSLHGSEGSRGEYRDQVRIKMG